MKTGCFLCAALVGVATVSAQETVKTVPYYSDSLEEPTTKKNMTQPFSFAYLQDQSQRHEIETPVPTVLLTSASGPKHAEPSTPTSYDFSDPAPDPEQTSTDPEPSIPTSGPKHAEPSTPTSYDFSDPAPDPEQAATDSEPSTPASDLNQAEPSTPTSYELLDPAQDPEQATTDPEPSTPKSYDFSDPAPDPEQAATDSEPSTPASDPKHAERSTPAPSPDSKQAEPSTPAPDPKQAEPSTPAPDPRQAEPSTPLPTPAWIPKWIKHNQVKPFPQPIPVTIGQKAAIKFKPHLHISTGCHPYPAVNEAGETNSGLKNAGAPSSKCKGSGWGSQVYGRGGWYRGFWVIMYGWYFPKDATAPHFGHRHDWEHVIVWIDNPAVAHPKILAVAFSAHDGYSKQVPPDPRIMNGTRVQVNYESHFPMNHELGPTTKWGENQDLIMWEQLSENARRAFNSVGWGNANMPLNKDHYHSKLKKAWPF